jgi:hypothetical protein
MVRRERRPLLCRITAHVNPVRDRGLRHTIAAHLLTAIASHQAKQKQHPREPRGQLTRHGRLHHPHPGQLGRPHANPVHPHMVAMAVATLRIVAQQQVRMLTTQQGSKPSRGFLNARAREPGPARRVLEQDRPVPAVRVAQMHGLIRTKDCGTCPQLLQPPPRAMIRAGPHLTITGRHDDHPVALSGEPGDRPAGQQHLVVRMSVKRHDRCHRREPNPRC